MPLHRNTSLILLSREHHYALQLCWKIKRGIQLHIDANRINVYTQWFYQNYLMTHFLEEEQYLFPLLSNYNELILQALQEHETIKDIISNNNLNYEALLNFATLLNNHVRFEERILFNKIQDNVSPYKLEKLKDKLKEVIYIENKIDEFWINKY